MTQPAITIGPDALVEEAARLMYDRRVKRLPVVNRGGLLVGIITRVDVLSVFDRPDDQIRREVIQQALPEALHAAPRGFEVTVRDGIVTVTGQVHGDHDSRAIVEAIRHIQGVVAVRDRLSRPTGGAPA
jgi:CBS domain-containing protein